MTFAMTKPYKGVHFRRLKSSTLVTLLMKRFPVCAFRETMIGPLNVRGNGPGMLESCDG